MQPEHAKVIAVELVKQPEFLVPASLISVFIGIKLLREILTIAQQIKNLKN